MNYSLENFRIEELQLILEHLKLGGDHLKKQLTPEQFKDLESYGKISQAEKEELKVTKIERFCWLSMIFNSIVTGIVGAWMGIAAAFEFDVGSRLPFVSGISFICAGVIGALLLYANKRDSQKALTNQKLISFEASALDLIYRKQKEKLNELIQKLLKRYKEIAQKEPEKEPAPFEKKEDFFSWFYLFHQSIHLKINDFPKDKIFDYYKEEIVNILKQTEQTFVEKGELIGDFGFALKKKEKMQPDKESSPLEILINPNLSTPKTSIKKGAWYKQGIFDLSIPFLPTLLGALSSILMWCNSAPLLTQVFNLPPAHEVLPPHWLSYIKIFISTLFTINFLFFFYYTKKREYLRKHHNEVKQKELLNKETIVVQMTQRLSLVYFLDSRLEEMMKYLACADILFKGKATTS